jgi:ABC-type branched-subunit amino acid transport system permease subunit
VALIRLVPPGLVVAVFLVLILSQVFYAALPYRSRAYIPILVMSAAGVGLGQLWDYLGLPSLRLGQANMLPAIAFALVLQPLARFVPRPRHEPKEPAEGNPPTAT